jgi:phytoene dehydrogenase-like protein
VAGGAMRCGELTLPGFTHDLGSAVHPLAAASPFFAALPLAEHGLRWIWPPAALAHPFGLPALGGSASEGLAGAYAGIIAAARLACTPVPDGTLRGTRPSVLHVLVAPRIFK